MRGWLGLALVLFAATTSACIDAFEPETGPLLQAPCDNQDSDPERAIHYREDIFEGIFSRPEIACVRCHTPAGETPFGVQETGFDLSSYASLRRGGDRTGSAIVIDGDACSSLLVQKVGPAPPLGSRMPLSGPPYLSPTDEQVLRDWIIEGAQDN